MTKTEHHTQAERVQRWERLHRDLTQLRRMLAKLEEPPQRGTYRGAITVEGDNWGSSTLDSALAAQLRAEAKAIEAEIDAV